MTSALGPVQSSNRFLGEVSHALYEGDDSSHQCMKEIQTFLRGGEAGAQRLKEILPSLFSYYKIVTTEEKANILHACHLYPYLSDTNDEVSFVFDGSDVRDQFRPRGKKHAWLSQIPFTSPSTDGSLRENDDED